MFMVGSPGINRPVSNSSLTELERAGGVAVDGGVAVGVAVGVDEGVLVGVCVGVAVGVEVGVRVGVGVAGGGGGAWETASCDRSI